jgi:protein O-mannosyl-transferase
MKKLGSTSKTNTVNQVLPPNTQMSYPSVSQNPMHWFVAALIVVWCFTIFSNIYDHGYVLDDLPTIDGNAFVKKGFGGFKEILTTRAWDGYNKDINIAAYRPMQLLLYAVERAFVGKGDPGLSHGLNIVYYSILCVFLYFTFVRLLRGQYPALPMLITLLFVVHPLHTEPVANLKSRDELLALMFTVLSMFALVNHVDKPKIWKIGLAAFAYLCALLSKETPVVFMVIFPLTLYFFRPELDWKKIATYMFPLAVAFVAFFLMRRWVFYAAGDQAFQHTHLQNPILAAKGFSQINGMKFWVLGKYLQLLIFPKDLTFSYFYDGIPFVKLHNWQVVLAILSYLGIGATALLGFKKRSVFSFASFYYLGSIALFSNFFIGIGDAMGERLAFTPSLGYAIGLAFVFYKLLQITPETTVKTFFDVNMKKGLVVLAALVYLGALFAYSYRTYDRNKAWHDNFTLCNTDYPTSPRSYILNRQMALTYLSFTDTIPTEKEKNLQISLNYFKAAVELDPTNPALWAKYAEACIKVGDNKLAKTCLENAVQRSGNTDIGSKIKLAEIHRKNGENKEAIMILTPLAMNPQYSTSYYLRRELGLAHYFLKEYDKAEPHFKEALRNVSGPDKAIICSDMGAMYVNWQRMPDALQLFLEGIAANPAYDISYNGAGVAYHNMGQLQKAADMFAKAVQINPNNLEAIGNLANTYNMLRDVPNMQKYTKMYEETKARLSGKK